MVFMWAVKAYLRNHLKPEIYGHGFMGILRQGMLEVPAVTLFCVTSPFIIGILGPIHHYKCVKHGRDTKRYMTRWSVYRPDDPRLDWVMLPPKMDAERQEMLAKMKQQKKVPGK